MKIKSFIKKILSKFYLFFNKKLHKNVDCHIKQSYSQCGEDIIISFLMNRFENWTWIDIGAHHPFFISNTAYFYNKGIFGINIEPDPDLIGEFSIHRPKDKNLNIAISHDKDGYIKFYRMESSVLNTLSYEEAERTKKLGYKIRDTISVPTMNVSEVINKYSDGVFPDVLFIDTEGYDLKILKSINYEKMYPKIICAETAVCGVNYENPFKEMVNCDITKFLISKGYLVAACTLMNTIYVYNNFFCKSH